MTDTLSAVAHATRRRREADREWRAAILAAVADRQQQSAIAEAAGVTREWVNKMAAAARREGALS